MSYKLLERCSIEIEYMLVDVTSLSVVPKAHQILLDLGADDGGDLERGEFTWSNEVTNHVLEIKTSNLISDFTGLHARLRKEILWMEEILEDYGLRLMPTAMHPWMDPFQDTELYPLSHQSLYDCYHRLFRCKGHGWTNLQSTHLYFTFGGEEDFIHLHTAARLLLPLLPALCASSPVVEGDYGDDLDNRLTHYQLKQAEIPATIGQVIPEAVNSWQEYEDLIIYPIREAIGRVNEEAGLEIDQFNARGAVAHFDRNLLEIRLLDTQECPRADVGIAEFIAGALQWLIQENRQRVEVLRVPTRCLAAVYQAAIHRGLNADFTEQSLLPFYGLKSTENLSMGEVLAHLAGQIQLSRAARPVIETILEQGNLSQRIRRSLGEPTGQGLFTVYRELADCLPRNELFVPGLSIVSRQPEESSEPSAEAKHSFAS